MSWGVLTLDTREQPVLGPKAVFTFDHNAAGMTTAIPAERDQLSALLARDLVAVLMGGDGLFVRKIKRQSLAPQNTEGVTEAAKMVLPEQAGTGTDTRTSASYHRLAGPHYEIAQGLDSVLDFTIRPAVHIASCLAALREAADAYSSIPVGRVYQAFGGELRAICSEFSGILASISVALEENDIQQQQQRRNHNGQPFALSDLLEHVADAGVPVMHAYEALQVLSRAASVPEDELPIPNDYKGTDGTLEYLVALQKRRGPNTGGNYAALINESVVLAQQSSNSIASLSEVPLRAWSSGPEPVPVLRGGCALGLLSELYHRQFGSMATRQVLNRLLVASSRPYLSMIRTWLVRGEIDDPFLEFVVRESSDLPPELQHTPFVDDYWSQKYRLWGPNLLPPLLADPLIASQLLTAGKHLNVLRRGSLCKKTAAHPANVDSSVATAKFIEELDSIESVLDPRLPHLISQAYDQASSALLTEFSSRYDLQGYLVACQRIYFGSDTEFWGTFLDQAEDELVKPVSEVSLPRLQYTLDMAIAQPGSASSQQPYLDELRISLAPCSLTEELVQIANAAGIRSRDLKDFRGHARTASSKSHPISSQTPLTALEAIQFDIEIPFPLSLIITRSSLYRYQFVSRHLLSLKVAIAALDAAWAVQSSSPAWRSASSGPLAGWRTRALSLRGVIGAALAAVQSFCVLCVVEESWLEFKAEQQDVQSVEALAALHLAFLDRCTKECMLTSEPLLICRAKVLRVAHHYAQFLLSAEEALAWSDPDADYERPGAPPVGESGQLFTNEELREWLESSLQYYEQAWARHMKKLVAQAQAASNKIPALQILCTKLSCFVHAG